jgi:hypothetical protein
MCGEPAFIKSKSFVALFSLEAVVECRTFQPLHFALCDSFLGNATTQDRDPTRPPTERSHDRERTRPFATVTRTA